MEISACERWLRFRPRHIHLFETCRQPRAILELVLDDEHLFVGYRMFKFKTTLSELESFISKEDYKDHVITWYTYYDEVHPTEEQIKESQALVDKKLSTLSPMEIFIKECIWDPEGWPDYERLHFQKTLNRLRHGIHGQIQVMVRKGF